MHEKFRIQKYSCCFGFSVSLTDDHFLLKLQFGKSPALVIAKTRFCLFFCHYFRCRFKMRILLCLGQCESMRHCYNIYLSWKYVFCSRVSCKCQDFVTLKYVNCNRINKYAPFLHQLNWNQSSFSSLLFFLLSFVFRGLIFSRHKHKRLWAHQIQPIEHLLKKNKKNN